MKTFNLYKHVNCTDVAFMPIKRPFYVPEKKVYKVKVRWFNVVNPKNVFDLGVVDHIEVKLEDTKNWRLYP